MPRTVGSTIVSMPAAFSSVSRRTAFTDRGLLVEVRLEARLQREVDDEDVLVHERRPEPIARDRAARRLDRPHAPQSDAMTSGVACCSPR